VSAAGHGHGGESCRELVERLSEYLDGELPAGLCDQIDAHMGDCPPCQVFLESLRRTVRWVGESGADGIPEEVRSALLKSADAVRRKR
jgi:RNA polymerase sigma-70 factor (ECF subfamily)